MIRSPREPATHGAPAVRRGPFHRWPRTSDALLALVVFLAAVCVEDAGDGNLGFRSMADLSPLLLLACAITAGALWWRRARPLLVLAVVSAGAVLVFFTGDGDLVGLAVIALYSVGRYAWPVLASQLALAAVIVLVALSSVSRGGSATEVGAALVATCLSWFVGRQVRLRGERAEQREAQRVAEAGRAVAEERVRIARELHDVVAHRVSLMTVQAGASRIVAARDPDAAREAMLAVEQAGRQALNELRHLLDVLRPDPTAGGALPQPGLSDIRQLVGQFRAAGLQITHTTAPVEAVPSAVELSTYRIVQEALTNVLRHSGPGSAVDVRVAAGTEGLVVEVSDDGAGTPATTGLMGAGHGLTGMRERAVLLGGTLVAGPGAGGGFAVVAHLPLRRPADRVVGR